MKFIYVPSVHHTGTWFTVAFLLSHPDIKGFVQLKNIENLIVSDEGQEHSIVTGHPEEKISEDINTNENGINILQSHILFKDSGHPEMELSQQALILSLPCIIPLRDPLLSLVTRHQRQPHQSHLRLISEWAVLVRFLNNISPVKKPFFLPLDLMGKEKPQKRSDRLSGAFSVAGVIPNGHTEHWSRQWSSGYNSRGDYDLKKRYFEKDVGYLRRTFPDEFTELKRHENLLRPFFDKQGYPSLLWYT